MKAGKIHIFVIIPCYNAAKCLERCMDSLLKQTWINFDIILVNDGSIDETERVCQKYVQKSKSIHLISKDNGGVSSARNYGLDYAKKMIEEGNPNNQYREYISFVDPDDYFEFNALEKCVERLESDNFDAVYFGYWWQGDESFNSINERLPINKTDAKTNLNVIQNIMPLFMGISSEALLSYEVYGSFRLNMEMGSVWRFVYSAKLIFRNNIKFNENVRKGEDLLFNLEVMQYCNKISSISSCLYHYFVSQNGGLYGRLPSYQVLLQDKIETLQTRQRIREYILNKHNIDIRDMYIGSLAMAAIGLSLDATFYKEMNYRIYSNVLKSFVNETEVQYMFTKIFMYKLPVKWKLPLFFIKNRMFICPYIVFKTYNKLFNKGNVRVTGINAVT